MKKVSKVCGALLAVLGLGLFSTASATIYTYESSNPHVGGNQSQATLDNLLISFDDVSNVLTMEFLYNTTRGPIDGLWIGVNEGTNPKGQDLGIFYIDVDSTTGQLRGSAYEYYKPNGLQSFANGDVIATADQFANAAIENSVITSATSTEYRLALDLDTLNPSYTGFIAGAGPRLGYWLSWFDNINPMYAADGTLSNWFAAGAAHAWSDTANLATTSRASEVPEPMTMTLLGTGLAFGAARRRKAKAS